MKAIVAPLRNVRPMLLFTSPSCTSFALSRTTLMCMSNARSVPDSCLSSFSCTKISFPFELFNRSRGLSIPLTINYFECRKFLKVSKKKNFLPKGKV